MAGPLHRRRERLRLEQERAVSAAAPVTYSQAFQQGVREVRAAPVQLGVAELGRLSRKFFVAF